ncbi:MAG TPA: NADPH-dependent F420 reductase [Acidimicrobiia bacterium]|nr:NADPH-dependent F420 reductase [Acidimicrobiia bacterium]
MHIGVLGGTGPAGRGLAARLASLGHDVVLGSRDHEKAAGVVAEVGEEWGARVGSLQPGTNEVAAAARDLVIIATTWEAAVPTARDHAAQLVGKVVVTMANGLEKVGREFRPVLPAEGSVSAAVQAAAPGALVVSAFQHVPASSFADLDQPLLGDIVVCADDDAARDVVLDLVTTMPALRAFDGGTLANAVGIEAFAALLLSINLRHKGKGSLQLIGVEGRGVEGRGAKR